GIPALARLLRLLASHRASGRCLRPRVDTFERSDGQRVRQIRRRLESRPASATFHRVVVLLAPIARPPDRFRAGVQTMGEGAAESALASCREMNETRCPGMRYRSTARRSAACESK